MSDAIAYFDCEDALILRVYDECEALLAVSGPSDAIAFVVDALAGIRSELSAERWRAAVMNTRHHHLLAVLRADPYTAQAFSKPRGYAGDAHTLDFVYGYRLLDAATPQYVRELHAISTNAAIARAVRERCVHVAATIGEVAARSPCAVVTSIACGHMRELHHVPDHVVDDIAFFGVDQDGLSLAALARLHPRVRVTPFEMSARALVAGRVILPRGDLIYASGLLDYLERRFAVALCRHLVATLQPGGMLLIPNLTPINREAAYMEAVMDWWMVYRDEQAMYGLGLSVVDCVPACQIGTYTTSDGRVAWLRVQRD